MPRFSTRNTVILLACLTLLIVPLSWYRTDAVPETPGPAKKTSAPGMRMVDMSITNAHTIQVDGSPATLETLGRVLDKKATADPAKTVIKLSCDADLPMGVLFDVQRTLQDRDLLKVSYTSDLSEAMPLVLPSEALEAKFKTIPAEDIAVVNVDGSGRVLFNQMKTSTDDLNRHVKAAIEQNDKLIVSIELDNDVTYENFVAVLRAVKDGDAKRIVINNPAR